jgi:hypothetical protein
LRNREKPLIQNITPLIHLIDLYNTTSQHTASSPTPRNKIKTKQGMGKGDKEERLMERM